MRIAFCLKAVDIWNKYETKCEMEDQSNIDWTESFELENVVQKICWHWPLARLYMLYFLRSSATAAVAAISLDDASLGPVPVP